jgi:hypothetical protein
MGKRSADIEREIAEHRDSIARKRTRLEDRVRTDVHDARVSVTEEIESRTKLGDYARERPLMTLATAFGAGVLLGGMSDSGGNNDARGEQPRTVRYRREASGAGDGMVASLLGSLTGPIGATLEDEVRSAIRDIFGRNNGAGEGDTAAQKEQQRFTM